MTFPVLYDTLTEVTRAYQTRAYQVYNLLDDDLATPSMFIIDTEGVIRWKYIGNSAGDRPELSTIKEQLDKLQSVDMLPTPEPAATSTPDVLVGTDVGDVAPAFTLPSTAETDRSLESYRGDKNLVLAFYRAFW